MQTLSPVPSSLGVAYSKRPRSCGGRVWEAPFLPSKSTGNRHTRRRAARVANPTRVLLDNFNDQQVGGYLHPTKGWRTVSFERSNANLIVAALTHNRNRTFV